MVGWLLWLWSWFDGMCLLPQRSDFADRIPWVELVLNRESIQCLELRVHVWNGNVLFHAIPFDGCM